MFTIIYLPKFGTDGSWAVSRFIAETTQCFEDRQLTLVNLDHSLDVILEGLHADKDWFDRWSHVQIRMVIGYVKAGLSALDEFYVSAGRRPVYVTTRLWTSYYAERHLIWSGVKYPNEAAGNTELIISWLPQEWVHALRDFLDHSVIERLTGNRVRYSPKRLLITNEPSKAVCWLDHCVGLDKLKS
jgi:hypothetical protein